MAEENRGIMNLPDGDEECDCGEPENEGDSTEYLSEEQMNEDVLVEATLRRGKVTIVGAGPIGTACGMTLAMKGTAKEIVFLDEDGSLAHAEGLDILQGQAYTKKTEIVAGLDSTVTKDSDIIVIAFGTRLRKDMTTLEELAEFNLQNFRRLIPDLLKHSPDAIFVVTSQPNEVACYMIWKISGISTSRIIGIGTNEATSRFRTKIRENLGVNDEMMIDGYMIGECADPFPAWGSVTLNGVPFRKMNPNVGTANDPGNWLEIINDMKAEKETLNKWKCSNDYSMGFQLEHIIYAIFTDGFDNENFTVCSFVKDCYGIREMVFLATPITINRLGVKSWTTIPLVDNEEKQLQDVAKRISIYQKTLLIY